MKRVALVLFFVVNIVAEAHFSVQGPGSAQEKLASGHWNDPSTNLMWTAKDNGNDITWGNAVKYCKNLNLAGYSDWRLPSIDELEGIYDDTGSSAPHAKDSVLALAGRAKGNLILTFGAREWSSTRVLDDRGHVTGYAWEYDFPHGRRWKDPRGYKGSLRALCVRHL